ncbi:MAG: DUF4339 domain-containing protein [Thermoguttaceae bacterium]
MESRLYIRVRGRILGPFDNAKLRELARRGQLSRLHEVSLDAMAWVRASEYPDLFLFVDDRVADGMASQTAQASRDFLPSTSNACRSLQLGGGGDAGAPSAPPPAVSKRWWYNTNGCQGGPVDEATIRGMLASGSMGVDDSVWTEGMTEWSIVRNVPGLFPAQQSPQTLASQGKFCHSCGVRIAALAEICPRCGVRQPVVSAGGSSGSCPNRVVACLLALFLGGLGVHKFYLGQTAWGMVYLLATILLCWTIIVPVVIGIVCLIEGICYLTYSDSDFARRYGRQSTA